MEPITGHARWLEPVEQDCDCEQVPCICSERAQEAADAAVERAIDCAREGE